ncbi:disulfide bond formation protein B [Microbulbifer taiwanensis]|uniref:Disulfide bond formation protein B n=1 Tax=Microbulbifer taiwanensis TaxID=986746 RepID=A0ABW1YMK6_9GAMM|nr:disulfide bond formation protein B [Microbulbifer taiwanensis]
MKISVLGRNARWLDALALLAVSATLWFAFGWQLLVKELPCPLCLLQRVAFIMVGIGLLMNLRFGNRPLHQGIVVLSALAGVVASARQVLLHIAPGDPGFGSPFLGLHFYTWALLIFLALLVYCGLMLMSDAAGSDTAPRKLTPLARYAALVFLAILVVNVVSTTLECGLGPCPDNPTRYQWLP